MITNLFLYVQIIGRYLGEAFVSGFYWGAFNQPINQTQALMQGLADVVILNLVAQANATGLVYRFRQLAGENDLVISGVNAYVKGTVGTSVAQNKAGVSFTGLRDNSTSGDAYSPNNTIGVYFPALTYGQNGGKWGLLGVYESDVTDGRLLVNSAAYNAAQLLIDEYQSDYEYTVGDADILLQPAVVGRIPYTTSTGKSAYRMPYLSSDEPNVYKVGSGSIRTVLGTNNLRKFGRGQ